MAAGDGTAADLTSPIINSPYDPPEQHFEIGPRGPTGKLLTGRRPSESYIPVPVNRKGRRKNQPIQVSFDFDLTGERREQNTLINDIRRELECWRAGRGRGRLAWRLVVRANRDRQPARRRYPERSQERAVDVRHRRALRGGVHPGRRLTRGRARGHA